MREAQQNPEPLAEQAFVIIQARRGLNASDQAAREKPVMYAEILHYVLGNDNIDADRVSRALASNLSNRRVYKQLLAQNRCAYAPREAHASDSDEVSQRIGEGFKIKFRAAKSRPGQMYIVLEIDYHNLVAGDKPLILHVSGDEIYCRLAFPGQIDHQTQVLLATQDPRLLSLRNMDTELSLV
ncbi:MAG: hypothetical protein ACI8WB_003388 [Phenylobacterium sp.]|jgi:hypothetical protein